MELELVAPAYNLITNQTLTESYVKAGSDIDCRHYSKIGVFIQSDVNSSTGIILKAVAHHTLDGTDYEIDGLSTETLPATDANYYYEFDCGAIPFLELQVKATALGVTPAVLTGDTGAEAVFGNWAAVTDASFRISIDGTAYNIDGIDFTGAGSMAAVALIIQTAIRTATGGLETCVWSTDHFIISSVLKTPASAITVLSTSTGTVGTDISGAGSSDWMDADTGNGVVTAVSGTAGIITSIDITKFN